MPFRNTFLKYLFVLILLIGAFVVYGSETDGTISSTYFSSLLCRNDNCSTTTKINFKTTLGTPIHVTDTAITGEAWSETMGWIRFNPGGGFGGVINNGSGVVSGYAWGDVAGWVNFKPTQGGVTINSTGQFTGWAWSENYGWIKFDCNVSNACVTTDWRPLSARGGGGGGGGGGGETDVCPNITGNQTSVPSGYILSGGNCVLPPTDVCPNIVGVQETIPSGYLLLNGDCVLPPADLCPNITGVQVTIPSGYILSGGDCVLSPTDVCPNIAGIQSTVPEGKVLLNGDCVDVVPELDSCPNIAGIQSTIPDGYVFLEGACVIPNPEVDSCVNISGIQTVIPEGYVLIDGQCVLPPPEVDACNNIPGTQLSVPINYILLNGECVAQNFCDLHPTDESCIVRSFCELHPTDPSCIIVPATFCDLNPTDPSCLGGHTSTFCETNPSDPSCINPVTPSTTEETKPLVPAITQVVVDNVVEVTKESIKKTVDISKKTTKEIKTIIETPEGSTTSKVVTTTGAISGAAVSVTTVLFANPLSFGELFLIPFRLWSLLLAALGLKKRNRPWGTVYDSVTKQPLDPAYVVLEDLNGKEIATSITDLDGRYGFLVPAGQYRMTAKKTNYGFPSNKLAGKTKDELYSELYFNEIISVEEDGVISKNIPMDPLKFDWNEFAKKDKNIMRFFSKRDLWIARISSILFIFGFIITVVAVIASPVFYNIIILVVYLILFVLKRTVLKPRAYGYINSKETKNPLSFAIMRVFYAGSENEVIHKVTDKTGKYYCLIPNGKYYTKIENKNDDQSYSLIHVSEPIEVKNGYISEKFEI